MVFGTIASFFAVLMLLLAAVLVLPKLIDLEAVRDRVRSELTEIVGAEVDFKRMDLSIFPSPHVSLYEPSLVLPTRLTASAEAITVYPEILPLLSWKLEIRELLIRQPDLSITLTATPKKKDASEKPPTISDLSQRIRAVVSAFPEFHIPNISSQLTGGRFKLIYGNKQVIEFHKIMGHLTNASNRIEFQLTGAPNLGEKASVSGWINTRQMKSNIRVLLTQLWPQVVYNALFPNAAVTIKDAQADLTIDLDLDGPADVQADIDLSMPQLTLVHGNETATIRSRGLNGRIHINNDLAMVSLSELVLESPKMRFSGHIVSSFDNPKFRLQLEGRDIDLRKTRRAANAIFREHDTIHDIFQIVKAGTVARVTLETQGFSVGDLGNMENMFITGQLFDGEFYFPGAPLSLNETSGDFVISRGILKGDNIAARLKNSSAKDGKLSLSLARGAKPFHLETKVQANLSDLPSILKHLIDHQGYQKELALLKEVKGTVKGKLVISGENTQKVKVGVEASEINLTAEHKRLPYLLQVTSGNLTYAENRIGVKDLSGRLGKSSISQLTAGLDFRKKPYLEITSGESSFYLSEIGPWLSSFDAFSELHRYYGGGEGIITLSAIHLKGPLFSPEYWHFNVSGAAEDLVVKDLFQLTPPVAIASGAFNVNPLTLSYTDAQMIVLDSTMTVSGMHRYNLEGIEKNGRMTVEGHIGPQFIRKVSNLVHLPSRFTLQPLTLSTSHLSWRTDGITTVTGNLTIQSGPAISMKILLNSHELTVKKLAVHDKASRATIELKSKEKVFDLAFNGNLHKSTVDTILQNNNILTGWIDGSIRARIDTRHISNFSLFGKLKGNGLTVPLDSKRHLNIGAFSLNGYKHKILIESADLIWNDMRLSVSGNIKPGPQKRVWIDMDMTTDSVSLDQVIQTLKENNENLGHQPDVDFMSLPIRGDIRFKTDRFKFGRYTWNPVYAEISIKKDSADVTVTKAAVCGVAIRGTLKISPQTFQFDINPIAKDQELNLSLGCFAGKSFKADGKYSIEGNFQGNGVLRGLLKMSAGHVELMLSEGHIYRDIVVSNVVEFLSATEVLTDHLTEQRMETKGFRYRSIRIKAVLKNGKILFEEVVLDGVPMTIVAMGEYNLLDGRLNIDLLAAPLHRLDRILEYVPLVGGVLHTLVSIPLSVKGPLNGVKVLPLHPSAVAFQLKELMENIVDIPINLVHVDDWRWIKSNGGVP